MVQRNKEHHNNPQGRPAGSKSIDGNRGNQLRYDPDSTAGYDWYNDEDAFSEQSGETNTYFLDEDPWSSSDMKWLDDSSKESPGRSSPW